MYKLLILLILFFCNSCAVSLLKKHKGIDPAFEPYISEIIENSQGSLTRKSLENLTMGFEVMEDPEIGQCNKFTLEIGIAKTYWAGATEESRLSTVMHEIGHCILNKYHTDVKHEFWHDLPMDLGFIDTSGRLYDFCPASIMHPYDISWYCFVRHKKYYMDEFFGRANAQTYQATPWRLDGGL
jgi:hypothetical protein